MLHDYVFLMNQEQNFICSVKEFFKRIGKQSPTFLYFLCISHWSYNLLVTLTDVIRISPKSLQ
jgi:hypothetical protein